MENNLVAEAKIVINAKPEKVWNALTNPDAIKIYMFGSIVESDWKENSPITWSGTWKGNAYKDRGKIIKIVANKLLILTHFSPLSGEPDIPENYHTLKYELLPSGPNTELTLQQDNNKSQEEKAHSEGNWRMMLEGIKKFLENQV